MNLYKQLFCLISALGCSSNNLEVKIKIYLKTDSVVYSQVNVPMIDTSSSLCSGSSGWKKFPIVAIISPNKNQQKLNFFNQTFAFLFSLIFNYLRARNYFSRSTSFCFDRIRWITTNSEEGSFKNYLIALFLPSHALYFPPLSHWFKINYDWAIYLAK